MDCVEVSAAKRVEIDLNKYLGETPREAMLLWLDGVRKEFEDALEKDFFALEEILNENLMYDDNPDQASAIAAFQRMIDEEKAHIDISTDTELLERCHMIGSLDDWEPMRET